MKKFKLPGNEMLLKPKGRGRSRRTPQSLFRRVVSNAHLVCSITESFCSFPHIDFGLNICRSHWD
ncbi:hypothetical protein BDN67DRAFT_972113 [Paxillus ammoniavirescens]|nr:hypothetical protein BDN67DRAFT_972113 [Paxillus ammoniavirescens]